MVFLSDEKPEEQKHLMMKKSRLLHEDANENVELEAKRLGNFCR